MFLVHRVIFLLRRIMNKTYRTLSLIILSSTLTVSAMENVQQDTQATISFYTQTTNQLQQAWQNKWVKVGTVSTACALLYAIGVRYNVVPAPSLPTLSLLALPVFAKKTIDEQELPQSPKNDAITVTVTENTQKEEAVETVTPSDNEQPTDNTDSAKTKSFPSRDDLKEAAREFRYTLKKAQYQ